MVSNKYTEELVSRKDLGKTLFTAILLIHHLLDRFYPNCLIVISLNKLSDRQHEDLMKRLMIYLFASLNN